jgi:hypothetical protein
VVAGARASARELMRDLGAHAFVDTVLQVATAPR